MDESQLLAKLHDIKLPAPTGWWPMAPGWIVLITLFFFSLVISSYFLLSRWANGRAKSQALRLLKIYYQAYQHDGNAQIACIRLSELLRRVALVYFPRVQVAGLHGEAWVTFLVQNAQEADLQAIRNGLLLLPYQVTQDNRPLSELAVEKPAFEKSNESAEAVFAFAKTWIKQRGKPCLS